MPSSRWGTASRSSSTPTAPLPAISTEDEVRPAAPMSWMAATAPALAVLFLLPALSLAGIPPFSGFAAKFGLFDATARDREWTILAVAVLVSLLTLFSIAKSHSVDVADLRSWNHLKGDNLKLGQSLRVSRD